MGRLLIELPEHIYKQLVKQAEQEQKLPEMLAMEKLIAEFGVVVRNGSQAKQLAKDYLAPRIGSVLVPQTPSLDKERAVWEVPISIEMLVEGWTEVGILEVDVNTGCVVEESPTLSALWKRFRDLLGIEDFPAEKQERMSELSDLGNRGKLTESLQAESEALLLESELHQNKNLRRMAQRLPSRRKK